MQPTPRGLGAETEKSTSPEGAKDQGAGACRFGADEKRTSTAWSRPKTTL